MSEQSQREQELQAKEVEKLEAAAEIWDHPEEIAREAAKPAEERHSRLDVGYFDTTLWEIGGRYALKNGGWRPLTGSVENPRVVSRECFYSG